MDVLDGQTDLSEPVQDLRFRQHLLSLPRLLYFLAEIASIRVAHENIEVALLCLEGTLETDNIRVVQRLQNLRLPHGLIDLRLRHSHDFYLLEDQHFICVSVANQVALAVGTLPQHLHFLILLALHLN